MYTERVNELNTVTEERDDMKRQYDELRKRRQLLFFKLLSFGFSLAGIFIQLDLLQS